MNGDVDQERTVGDFPRDDDETAVPAGRAVIYLGAWPAGVVGPFGGEILVKEFEDGPISFEDELLRDVESALLDAGEDIERKIEEGDEEELVTDGGLIEHQGREAVAAEEYDGDQECDYSCGSVGEYSVELRLGTASTIELSCNDCSQQHRLWVEENGLLAADISEEVLD